MMTAWSCSLRASWQPTPQVSSLSLFSKFFFFSGGMSGAILPTQLAELARGDLAWLRAFLSGRRTRGTSLAAQLDARNDTEKQDTLLTWAARHGQAEAARLLLEGGASVEAADSGGATALLIASEEGHLDCVRLLVEAGAATDRADAEGCTPLLIASQEGQLEISRLLVEANAAVDQTDDEGTTPLSAASLAGEIECARLLLEAGMSALSNFFHIFDRQSVGIRAHWAKPHLA